MGFALEPPPLPQLMITCHSRTIGTLQCALARRHLERSEHDLCAGSFACATSALPHASQDAEMLLYDEMDHHTAELTRLARSAPIAASAPSTTRVACTPLPTQTAIAHLEMAIDATEKGRCSSRAEATRLRSMRCLVAVLLDAGPDLLEKAQTVMEALSRAEGGASDGVIEYLTLKIATRSSRATQSQEDAASHLERALDQYARMLSQGARFDLCLSGARELVESSPSSCVSVFQQVRRAGFDIPFTDAPAALPHNRLGPAAAGWKIQIRA